MSQQTSTQWLNDLKEGDTVYLVAQRRKSEVTIDKVGRTILHIGSSKFFKETGRQQTTMGAAAQLYPSQEVYDAMVLLDKRWQNLQHRIARQYHLPAGMTLQDIEQIENLIPE
jgi:hypothetical protein